MMYLKLVAYTRIFSELKAEGSNHCNKKYEENIKTHQFQNVGGGKKEP